MRQDQVTVRGRGEGQRVVVAVKPAIDAGHRYLVLTVRDGFPVVEQSFRWLTDALRYASGKMGLPTLDAICQMDEDDLPF